MANEYAQFLSPWTTEDQAGELVNVPKLPQDYPVTPNTLTKWQDITGQPTESITPDPNQYVIELWADTATMDAIEADSQYTMVPGTWVDLDVPLPPPEEPSP